MEQRIANMRHEDWSVRVKAFREVGNLRVQDPKVVEILAHAVRHDPSPRARQEAAEALGKVVSPESIDSLIGALSDQDWGVRNNAVWALGQLKDPRAIQPLIDALGDLDWRARNKAASALGAIKDPRAIEPLIAALKDESDVVRDKAREALADITGKRFLFGGRNPARWRKWWAGHKDMPPASSETTGT